MLSGSETGSPQFVGDPITLTFEATVDDVDTDPTTLIVTLVHPDGASSTLTPVHDGAGQYHATWDSTGQPSGRYTWIATATGAPQAVAAGIFDLLDPSDTSSPLTSVAPWTDATGVAARPGCADIDRRLLDDCARGASNILYGLSGRQYAGRHVTTVRPTAARLGDRRPAGLWLTSWGSCPYAYAAGYGTAMLAGWAGHNCNCHPPRVELGGYPVTQILAVKIDGITIPDDEYQVFEHRLLVRTRSTATSTPTGRAGWPTCQRLDLPDTEPGTFSVQFAYGAPPPPEGVLAANSLAAELALATDPGENETRLPERVKSIVRQGESVTLIDPQDVLDKGRTGIPEVDLFIKAANPAGLIGRSSAWSPDIGSARRPG